MNNADSKRRLILCRIFAAAIFCLLSIEQALAQEGGGPGAPAGNRAAGGVAVVEGTTFKVTLGYANDEKRVPITLRGSPGNLPPVTVTVSEFTGTNGTKFTRGVGIARAGARPALSLSLEGGRPTAHLQLVFGKGHTDPGTYTGRIFVDSQGNRLDPITATAVVQGSNPVWAFLVLFAAGTVGWFLVNHIQKARALRELERRANLIEERVRSIDTSLLPRAAQDELEQMRAAFRQRDAAAATDVIPVLEKRLVTTDLVHFTRDQLGRIQDFIEEGRSRVAANMQEERRLLGKAEQRRQSVSELAGTDLDEAQRQADRLVRLTQAAFNIVTALHDRNTNDAARREAQEAFPKLADHLADDEGWWLSEPVIPERFFDSVEAKGTLRRLTAPVAQGAVATRKRARPLVEKLRTSKAVLFYGGVLSLCLVSLVGLQVLYLGNPTFGSAGVADWIGLVAWGVGIQAGGTSMLGLLRSVTPERGLELLPQQRSEGTTNAAPSPGGRDEGEPRADRPKDTGAGQ